MKKLLNFLLVVSILVISSVSLEAKWYNLKKLEDYDKISDFNLKKGIDYIEIRSYLVDENNNIKKRRYSVLFSAYRKKLSDFDRELVRDFRLLKPIKAKGSDLVLESNHFSCKILYNAFVITDKNKIFKMNMKDDILSFLDEIDTDGEFVLMAWIRAFDRNIIKYRKSRNGFDGIIFEQPNVGIGKCVDTTYKATFDKGVRFLKQKTIKSQKTNRDCLGCILEIPMDCD